MLLLQSNFSSGFKLLTLSPQQPTEPRFFQLGCAVVPQKA
jgi:hypothetical protein